MAATYKATGGIARRVDDDAPFGSRLPSLAARLAWLLSGQHAALGLPGRALWKRLGVRYPGPFDHEIDGMRLRIYPTENFGDRVIAYGRNLPESEEFELAFRWLKPGGKFIDIGANIGLYSIAASRCLGPSGKVLAIEPHPGTARKLAFNLATNGCSNVTTLDCALGEGEGDTIFFPDSGKNAGRSSVLAEAVGAKSGSVAVNMQTLAGIVDAYGFGNADLIKIDVEGYEDRVLATFFANTPKILWPRAVLLEDAHRDLWQADVVSAMLDRNYRQIGRTPSNLLLARDFDSPKNT